MAKMQKMARMTAYSNGYTPPTGNAGAAAKGEFSTKSNPMSVPKKGSSINSSGEFGMNSDHSKVMSLKQQQASKESLRGQSC